MTTAVTDVNPTLARRALAVIFSGLREQRGLAVGDVAEHLGVSQSMASRLETGARGYKVEDAEKLAKLYDLGGNQKKRVRALAEESRKRTWWQQVELHDSYRTLIGFEQAAESVFEYAAIAMPGLLQTREYAEACAAAMASRATRDEITAATDIRVRRQQVLDKDAAPGLEVVIDESVLARGAGGPDVMRAQLHHLIEMSNRPGILIQVLPFTVGIYPSETVQFIILELPSIVPDYYYSELLTSSGKDTDKDETVRDKRRIARELQALALDRKQSEELIESYAKNL